MFKTNKENEFEILKNRIKNWLNIANWQIKRIIWLPKMQQIKYKHSPDWFKKIYKNITIKFEIALKQHDLHKLKEVDKLLNNLIKLTK